MSMVAHGYGIAATASPNIIFSNILWGYIVRSLPAIGGVLGYSIATFAALFVAWAATIYLLKRSGSSWLAATAISMLVFTRAVLFPQFTVNAGLLATVAVLALVVHSRKRQPSLAAAAALLGFIGFIIRAEEFALVAMVALPVLIGRRLYRDRAAILAILALIIAATAAINFDGQSYEGPGWAQYSQLNASRAPYTDFGADELLLKRPDILARYGYTKNDVELIHRFFFVDHTISNPVVLTRMRADLGIRSQLKTAYRPGVDAIAVLWQPEILPMVLAAAVFFCLAPSLSIACSWLVLFGTLFVMGAVGRGGLLRVEVPAVALVCTLSWMRAYASMASIGRLRKWIGAVVTIAALLFTARALYPLTINAARTVAEQQAAVAKFPRSVVVAWGAGMQFESIFPPLARDAAERSAIKIMPFGVFTYAPFSVAYAEEQRGRGFVTRIRSDRGVLMIAEDDSIARLKVWCSERFNGEFRQQVVQSAPYVRINRVWCSGGNGAGTP